MARSNFPKAERELTGEEIINRYGDLIERFYEALGEDPGMVVLLAEGANVIMKRKAMRRAASHSATNPRTCSEPMRANARR